MSQGINQQANLPISPEEILQEEVTLPTDKITKLKIDDIEPNSVLVINVDVESPMHKMAVAPVFSKLFAPYAEKLREKKVTVLLMLPTESINIISEKEMNQAGWFKQEKSVIINPFDK